MKLSEALLLPDRGTLSLVGGGGKSTLMLRLARELAADGRRAVVTTTTHISRAQGETAGPLLDGGDGADLGRALEACPVVCIAAPCGAADKLGPPPDALLTAAGTLAHWVLAEADGARRLPVKAPADHEPVLLPGGLVCAVAGLSALGRPLARVCHRPGLAADLLGVAPEALLSPDLLARLLTSPKGQRKGVEDPARFRVVLNQADDPAALDLARETAAGIRDCIPGCRVAVTALWEENCVKEVF